MNDSEKIPANSAPPTPCQPNAQVMLKKILAPVDFSRASREGLSFAASVATQFDARLELLYVVETPSFPQWGYAHLVMRDLKMKEEAEKRLPEFVLECPIDPRLVGSSKVTVGDPDLQIAQVALEDEVDLVIMASHGMSTIKHTLLGSTAERVVRTAHCPVLTVREPIYSDSKEKPPFCVRRILVPTDFSPESKKAFPYAVAFARRFGATLVLAYVMPSVLPVDVSHLGIVFEEVRMVEEARLKMKPFRAAEFPADLPVETHVFNGDPAWELTKAADLLHTDLVVISTHGHSALKHLWCGSVAERVVRHASSPVLVVREREHEFVV